jgi:hypothetical protein
MDAASKFDPDLEDSGHSSADDAGGNIDAQSGATALASASSSTGTGMLSLSFMRTDSGPVLINSAYRSYSGNNPDDFPLPVAGYDSLVLDAFDSPDLTSDQVLSKSGRGRHHPPAQELPHRSFPSFSTYGEGLFRDQLDPQFMIEESDFDESSCQSTDDSSASLGKRRRGPFDFKHYINNCELSPLSSSSSSPDAIDTNANSRVSWVRTRGKSGQFLGWGEVEVRISMTLDASSCVDKRIAIITRRTRNEACGISNSTDADDEAFSNYNKVATLGRIMKVPPPSPEIHPITGSLSRYGRGKLGLDHLRSVLGKSAQEPVPSPWVAPSDSNFQCAYELCPYPTKSSGSWKTVTKDTTAGQRDWLPYIGLTFCHACWTQFRTRGTLERLGRRPDEPPPPPTNDVIRGPVTVPQKSPRLPASSPRLGAKTKSQSPAISSRATPSMTPKAGKSQSPALKPIGSPALHPQKALLPHGSFQPPISSAKSPKSSAGRVWASADSSASILGASPRAPASPLKREAASPRDTRPDSSDMEHLALPQRQFSSSSAKH